MESLLDGVSGSLISKSLDMTLMRHQVIANNIANVNTDGFRPVELNFEEHLQSIKSNIDAGSDRTSIMNQIEKTDMFIRPTYDESTNKVLLDREMAKLAENTINYQALLSMRGELGSILSSVIKGGGNQ